MYKYKVTYINEDGYEDEKYFYTLKGANMFMGLLSGDYNAKLITL